MYIITVPNTTGGVVAWQPKFEDPYLEAEVVEVARVGRPPTTNKIIIIVASP